MLHSPNLLSHFSPLSPSSIPHPSLPLHPIIRPLPTPLRSTNLHPLPILAENNNNNQEPETETKPAAEPEGPIELPSSPSTIFAVDDNPSPLQISTSVLLTGAISVFLFRSLRRRARRAKELRVRSMGVKTTKDIKEEALESLKAMGAASVEPGGPPSPVQAFLGGIAAGVIAVILYKFTITIEAGLNRQAISDNFSVRQITVTIRTIINGLCYLATFVFGINSMGLILYSIQLTFNSFMEGPADNSMPSKVEEEQSNLTNDTAKSTDNADSITSNMQESSDDS